MQRDVMRYDVLIVGAGPAGLAAAIRLKQQAVRQGREISVCVLEKAARIGGHILSGAILDPTPLDELLPTWRTQGAPIHTPIREEHLAFLSKRSSWRLPGALIPPLTHHHNSFVISLGDLCVWLAQQAEALGVEIYPGFAATELLHGGAGEIVGVLTGDMGRDSQGQPGPQFAPGMELRAAYTLIAEGARGSLTQQLEKHFGLRQQASPQKYALGIKEIWRIPSDKHVAGRVQHTLGWPLDAHTEGGGFLYHYDKDLLAVGFVVHLDYANPHLSPFEEFQRFKTHPAIRPLLEGSQRLSYGARSISAGGLQSLPELVFPGGALLGCSAGMLNVPRIQGIHNAMRSGMLAAESLCTALAQGRQHDKPEEYARALQASNVWRELDSVRNVKPWLARLGLVGGSLIAGLEMWLAALHLRAPWTLGHRQADHACLQPADTAPKIDYPKPDGRISFDRPSSIALSNITHDAHQPCHLHLHDTSIPIKINLPRYALPEQRYCPAGVYEIVSGEAGATLRINAQNCLHCKACSIKDPSQNIEWQPPEGGSGPNHNGM
nr:electron transfer flavoprotein-ubiquinone oxidoreductase [Uliginosibacterium gangwonense]